MGKRFARGAGEDECVAHDEKAQLCLGRGQNEFLAESGVELAKLEWIFFFYVLRGQAQAGRSASSVLGLPLYLPKYEAVGGKCLPSVPPPPPTILNYQGGKPNSENSK